MNMQFPKNYDKYPKTNIHGFILQGWDNIKAKFRNLLDSNQILLLDEYIGVYHDEILRNIKLINPSLIIDTNLLMKDEKEIRSMTYSFVTDDVLFGYVTNLKIEDYFDLDKLEEAKFKLIRAKNAIVIGPGAFLLSSISRETTLIYLDMARWEIQQRFRRHEIDALGVKNRDEEVSKQYKRGYFNDWRVLDKYKEKILLNADYFLDTNKRNDPRLIDKQTFLNGIEKTCHMPFRVVPFFDPAPWGGQWMKNACSLDKNVSNYGWCFDCVPEENSLYFNVDGIQFEIPSQDLIILKSKEILGGPVEARFGKSFPIRFDFLDTIGGGNLSLQVHPTTQFIQENMGMPYTQDESYYILDAEDNASVFLGLKTGVNKDQLIKALNDSQRNNTPFDAERFINRLKAKKHDHFLIPAGTIHCSASGALVLEISSTPNIFTFKLYDWQRLGLDGKPRPINIERGKEVIDFNRDTNFVLNELANQITKIHEEEGLVEEKTGLHENEFIETRRYWTSKPIKFNTNKSVNVFNLVDGDEAIITSPTSSFEPFTVHYAETFIIPAVIKEYIITPSNEKPIGLIRAYVRH